MNMQDCPTNRIGRGVKMAFAALALAVISTFVTPVGITTATPAENPNLAAPPPRYAVRFVKFVCIDESGWDKAGSDEPYWVFTARANGKSSTFRSQKYGNVDSGDTRTAGYVIWPANDATAGASGPIALSIQLWENDQGNPDNITRKTKDAFAKAENIPFYGEWIKLVPDIVRNYIAGYIGKLLGDDLMGSWTVHYSESTLVKELPKPGNSFTKKLRFNGKSGDLHRSSDGADYDLYIEVKRVS